MIQRIIEIESPVFVDARQLPEKQPLAQLFPKQQPLALEIGCGTGDFVVQRAAQQPQYNFLAIDIYNKGCYRSCRRIEDSGLQNIRVMRIEARYLLSRFGQANELAAIYINCPDPWPKKRHRSRRLVNELFLTQMLYYLQAQGDLFFATDVEDYAQQVAEIFTTLAGYRNQLASGYVQELAGYPLSKYMRRFLGQGLPIHFQHYQRDATHQLDLHALPITERGFRNRHTLSAL